MRTTGIILAGGQSRRMGQDKGLVLFQSKPLICHAIETLKTVADEIIIIANDEAYEQFGLTVYPDQYPKTGPLGGICTGLAQSQNDQNLVLSCDTPFVSPDLLSYLLRQKNGKLTVCVHEGQMQPLVGIYPKALQPKLLAFLEQGTLGMQKVMGQLEHQKLIINDQLRFYHPQLFFNINRPEDLEKASRLS